MLSTTAEYALRIVTTLAEAGEESVTSEQIAEATKVPPDYAVKILQWLGRVGLVRGRRGRGGGFRLLCDPAETTLLDVVNAIEPVQRITECPLGRTAHRGRLCPLHRRLDEIMGLLEDSLAEMTIEDVIAGQREPALCEPKRASVRISARRARPSTSAKSSRKRRR